MHASREDIYDETKSDTGGVVSGGIRVLHWRFLSCTNSTTGNLHVLLVAEIWKPFDLSLQNETCMHAPQFGYKYAASVLRVTLERWWC
jgi:hypothetical protein